MMLVLTHSACCGAGSPYLREELHNPANNGVRRNSNLSPMHYTVSLHTKYAICIDSKDIR